MHYTCVKRSGIYFVFTSMASLSLCWAVELLNSLVKSFKDFCGVLSEESLRRNFILIYELIDEIIDSGYPQTTASEILKLSVHSEAVDMNPSSGFALASLPNALAMIPQLRSSASVGSSTIPSSANQRPIGMTSSAVSSVGSLTLPGNLKIPGFKTEPSLKNEIFVDILEKVNVIVRGGVVVKASIDGSIQMKSYLTGNPSLRVSLNEDLKITTDEIPTTSFSSSSILDDANFHECADLTEFPSSRIISLTPPDGEFVLMNYRIANFDKLPFRLHPNADCLGADRLDVSVAVRADLPEQNYGSNLVLVLVLPFEGVRSVSSDVAGGGQSGGQSEYSDNRIVWTLKKLTGGTEIVCRARIIVPNAINAHHALMNASVALSFEVPMHSVSNMQVRYLRINGPMGSASLPSNSPYRWVRYVTQSQSYVWKFSK